MKTKTHQFIKKRGFTIVELTVVILIIAILTAVLIPTFTEIIKKAEISTKTQLASSMNDLLSIYEVTEEKPSNLGEVMRLLRKDGFLVSSILNDKDDLFLIWDRASNRFALLDADFNTLYSHDGKSIQIDCENLWIAVKELPSEQSFSLYLDDSFDQEIINVSVGIDTGTNTAVKEIIYTDGEDKAKEVSFISNSEEIKLQINNSKDTIDLSGRFGEIYIIDPVERDKAIVNIDGEAEEITIEGGSLNLEENSNVEHLNISAENADDFCITVSPTASITTLTDQKNLINDTNYNDGGIDNPTEEDSEFDPTDIVPESGKVAYIVSTETQISSLEEALRVGGEIILLAHTVEKELVISHDTTIDLNGYTISNGNAHENVFLLNGTTLTIKDSRGGGVIENNHDSATEITYAIKAENNATVRLEGGSITAEKRAIFLENSEFIMSGGSIISQDPAIVTKNTADITVSGGEIQGRVSFMDGEFKISGGKFRGELACITMKKGTILISGGEFYTSGEKTTDFPGPSVDTIETCGAVLHVDLLKGTSGNANINISGGKFTSDHYSPICITGSTTIRNNYSATLKVSNAELNCPEGVPQIIYRGIAEDNITVQEGITVTKK